MEYDRALYRVYERVMDDLAESGPPPALAYQHTRRSSGRSNGSGGTSIPMFVPVSVVSIVDPMIESIYNGNLNWNCIRHGLRVLPMAMVQFWYRLRRSGSGSGSRVVMTMMPVPQQEQVGEEDIINEAMGDIELNSTSNATTITQRNNSGEIYDMVHTNASSVVNANSNLRNRRNVPTNNNNSSDSEGRSSSSSGSSSSASSSVFTSSSTSASGVDSSQDSSETSISDSDNSVPVNGLTQTTNNNSNMLAETDRTASAGAAAAPSATAALAQAVTRRQRDQGRDRQRNRDNRNHSPQGCTQKGIYTVMRFSMWLGLLHVFIVYALHTTYVGAGMRRRRGGQWSNGRQQQQQQEQQRQLQKISTTCVEYALQTRPPEERDAYFRQYGDYDESQDDEATYVSDMQRRRGGVAPPLPSSTLLDIDKTLQSSGNGNNAADGPPSHEPPLLGRDEILQIRILFGKADPDDCAGQCSRVHKVIPTPVSLSSNQTIATLSDASQKPHPQQQVVNQAEGPRRQVLVNNGTGTTLPTTARATQDPMSTLAFWQEPHYRFATSEALLFTDQRFNELHNVSIINVTLTERCLATGSDDGEYVNGWIQKVAQFLAPIYGMDGAIINQLMYGIKTSDGAFRNGYLKNMDTKERWSWKRDFLGDFTDQTPMSWLLGKLGTALLSILAFFLVTSITSLIVRVLTSSGVIMMFPLFSFFRRMGLPGADERILSVSYPWIGRARAAVSRNAIHPHSHLVGAHMAKIFLYYVMYEACQAAWSIVLYGKSIPAAMPIWIYGFSMVWEYFSMVFVRSALSVYFFPRVAFLYFVLYHLYFYSVPYGYFDVALVPLFFLMLQAMMYTILALEVPAVSRGVVSLECPREVYPRLSWPEWSATLPQEWTLFLPLNSRYTPLYDREIVMEGGNGDSNENDDNEEENNIVEEPRILDNGQPTTATTTAPTTSNQQDTANRNDREQGNTGESSMLRNSGGVGGNRDNQMNSTVESIPVSTTMEVPSRGSPRSGLYVRRNIPR